MPVNIYDIAEKTGLSVVTVSRVLNNYPNVREKNRQKVLAAIKELDYKPNAAARTLANGRTGLIGLVLPSFNDAFMTQVMSSAEKALREAGKFLAVTAAADSSEIYEEMCLHPFLEERVDGMLVMSPLVDTGYILELKKKDVPLVLLDQHQQNLQVPSVTVDNFSGGYDAAMALIRGGARRIGHITGPDLYESSRERTRGFLKALEDNGLEIKPEHLLKGNFSVESGYKAARQWIESNCLPDAVFAADDSTAFGVLDAARQAGIKVPEQLSLIGYDDHILTSLMHPCISTVHQPAEEMGQRGVELLLDIIEDRPKRVMKVVLKPEVVLRETTI